MNNKILIGILGMILLVGLAAANSLYNTSSTMTVSAPAIFGGESLLANFSFSYPPISENYNNSALIIKLNLTSSNQTSYPVGKGDFKINGRTEKCGLGFFGYCLLPRSVPFSCIESNQNNQALIVNNIFGNNTENNVSPGVFYCFNESNYLELSEGDNVFLNITPNIALWPGNYTINASLFYLNDTLPPFVNITNKADFDRYYRPGNYLLVNATITENVGLRSYYGIISNGTAEYSVPFWRINNGFYQFTETSIPNNLIEGNYPLTVTAIDTSGNIGNDTVILKLDETGPTITVIQPTNNSLVSDMLPIELNATDSKSGVNQSSVYYELAAVINGAICPDVGIGINATCPNTHWVNLPYNITTGDYFAEVNTTQLGLPSGSYWLYANASDNLGNIGVLS